MPLRFLTAGESHGESLAAIVEGIPAGLKLSAAQVNCELKRRLPVVSLLGSCLLAFGLPILIPADSVHARHSAL